MYKNEDDLKNAPNISPCNADVYGQKLSSLFNQSELEWKESILSCLFARESMAILVLHHGEGSAKDQNNTIWVGTKPKNTSLIVLIIFFFMISQTENREDSANRKFTGFSASQYCKSISNCYINHKYMKMQSHQEKKKRQPCFEFSNIESLSVSLL